MDPIQEVLDEVRKLKFVPMEQIDRERWKREAFTRTAEQILKEGVIWGCRDVATVMKKLLEERGKRVFLVEGLRIGLPGGHMWIQVDGKFYDRKGEFHPILCSHGPYLVVEIKESIPVKNYDEWKARYLHIQLAAEGPAIAYAAFGASWFFFHTERVVFWAKKLAEKLSFPKNWEPILAAWLHDIGYVKDSENHAEIGACWAERWLKERGVPEDRTVRIVDGIRNHGSKAKPKTEIGHILRLSDALALWDPVTAGIVRALARDEREIQRFLRTMEKKWKVIEEYGKERLVDREKVFAILGVK